MTGNEEFARFLASADYRLQVAIRVQPNAKRTEVVERMSDGETWKVRIATTPENGKANAELINFLEKTFSVKAELMSGKSNRSKRIRLWSKYS
jgi:uncharacterized protein (TIGR00251 family)